MVQWLAGNLLILVVDVRGIWMVKMFFEPANHQISLQTRQ